MNLLNVVIAVPAIGFLLTLFLPRGNSGLIRTFAFAVSLVVFGLSLALIGPVTASPAQTSFVTNVQWIEYPSIRYHVGLDGLSLWLVILSTLLTPIVILVSWNYIQKHVKEFYAFILLLEAGLVAVFCSLDLFLFYVFWEVALVPMYFLVGIWGHEKRIYAAVKFFLYTMTGSVLMLAAIIWLYNKSGTFDIPVLLDMLAKGRLGLSPTEQFWLFLAFFFAFAIKVPLFPLHTWLPDAHGEAPTAGSVMLASVMLKMGTYGLVRICLPLFPQASRDNANWIAALAICGIIYGALVAMVQPNMKRLVAYSSVSHLGFVVLGIFSFNQIALDGAVYQMLNHGVSTGALFILVGYLYERRHSLEISDFGGVSTPAPWLATVFLVTTLASIGLPLLNNFVGEFLILQGVAQVHFAWTVWAASGVILSACYMLWMVQRTFYGETPEAIKHHMPDLSSREWAAILPLVALMVWMGVYTQSFLPSISASNQHTLSIMKTQAVQNAKEFRMPANFMPSSAELLRFLPEIIMTVMGTLIMLIEAVRPKMRIGPIAALSLLAALAASVYAYLDPGPAFSGLLIIDGFGTFFRFLVIAVGFLTVFASTNYLKTENVDGGEYYALLLFSITGQCVMATANELVMLFIGLECSSIATYILAGYLRDDKRNSEAALKYFLMGSFATAFLLYGVAWTYGLTASTNLSEIRRVLLDPAAAPNATAIGAAIALMFVGLAFKVSAAPFQVWAPDVYQGAAAPVSGFMSAGPKAAAFAMFLRIFMTAFEPVKDRWEPLLWASALATMIVGNFAALRQTNVKRLLAYSSIAHAGYVLVAVTTHSEVGTAAAMFYLASYVFMQVGAFAIVTHIARKGEKYTEIEDLSGLGQRQPITALLLTVFLLSLIGVPLTGGFFAKFYVFKAALDANLIWLTVLGLLTSAVAAYYYLRLIVVMYMQAPAEGAEPLAPMAGGLRLTIFSTAAITIILGVFPSMVLDFAGRSAAIAR